MDAEPLLRLPWRPRHLAIPGRRSEGGRSERRSSGPARTATFRSIVQAGVIVACLILAAVAAGCGRVPKIIVLEDPLSAQEHVALGVAYEQKGELDLAQREYERALKKEKDNFQARVNLGNVRLAKKAYGEAREEYLRALAIRPGDPEATNNLAWTAAVSGEHAAEARERLEAVLRDPARRTPTLLDTLGALLERTGDLGGAENALAEALSACEASGTCPDAEKREIRNRYEEVRKRRTAVPPPTGPGGSDKIK